MDGVAECQQTGQCVYDLSAGETPVWGEFVAMYIVWPLLTQVALSVFIRLLMPVYSLSRERSVNFRIFLRRYVGMPDRSTVTYPQVNVGIQVLRLLLALLQSYFYARRTYLKGAWNLQNSAAWEYGISVFFMFSFFLDRLSEGFQWHLAWLPFVVVDTFVITPMFLPYTWEGTRIPEERWWLSLGYLRIVTALAAFMNLQRLWSGQYQSPFAQCFLSGMRLAAMIVCMAGTIFVLEILGEIKFMRDFFILANMGELSIFQMCYWIVTTVSTVGYGDFSPTTVPSRTAIICFIFCGVIFFGSETATIVNMLNDAQKGLGSYRKSSQVPHILITGNGCHMSSPLMETLLLETLTDEQWNVPGPDLVFLSDRDFDPDLKSFVEFELTAGQSSQVTFLRGSLLNARDLERAQFKNAQLCFIVPDQSAEDVRTEDSANIMMSLSVMRWNPQLRIRLMLLEPEGARRAHLLGIPPERCFSAQEIKCALFAQSTRIRGLLTFLSGLLQARTNFADHHLRFLHQNYPRHWRLEYSESLRFNLTGFEVSRAFDQMPFPEALVKIYQESHGAVLLIAAEKSGRLVLNYTGKLNVGRVVVAIARSQKDTLPFSHQGAEAWTTHFLKDRSSRIQREAKETLQALKSSDSLHLVQHGASKRTYDDSVLSGNVKPRIFDSEVSEEELFRRIDADNDGHVTKEELLKAIQMDRQAKEEAPDLTVLREKEDLTLLVVLGQRQAVWEEVDCFLSFFRDPSLPARPIVLLSNEAAPAQLLRRWETMQTCFVTGDTLNIRNLLGAGARQAASIITMGRKVLDSGLNLDAGLGDADSVALCGSMEQALLTDAEKHFGAAEKRRRQLRLYEFGFTQSVFLMTRIDRTIRAVFGNNLSHSESHKQIMDLQALEGDGPDSSDPKLKE
ncbi:unnamed protein product, partial [Effrenium voratum]